MNCPTDITDRMVRLVEEIKPDLLEIINRMSRQGMDLRDAIFVAATADAPSQATMATVLNLGVRPGQRLPVCAVSRSDFCQLVEPIYRERGGERSLQALQTPVSGKITLWLVVDNWPMVSQMMVVDPNRVGRT